MDDEESADPLIAKIEEAWGEELTGTRRKHLREILDTIRTVAGEPVAEEVAAWVGENSPDIPEESVRLYAAREHAVGRDRFGFR